MYYWFAYYCIKIFLNILLPIKVYGLEHVPRKGAFLVASNHISNLDPPLIGSHLPRKIAYMAKDTLFKNKFLGFVLRAGNAFPVKRESSDFGAMKNALRCLRAGCPLLVFPEGTRTPDHQSRKIQPGAGFLVAKSGVPVLPVKIIGSDQALGPGSFRIKRHPVSVVVGPPQQFSSQTPYAEIAEQIIRTIDSLDVP